MIGIIRRACSTLSKRSFIISTSTRIRNRLNLHTYKNAGRRRSYIAPPTLMQNRISSSYPYSKSQSQPEPITVGDKNSPLGISTEWVAVSKIPPNSTLDDLLMDVERIMQTELATGIVDLDAAEEMLRKNENAIIMEQGKEEEEEQQQQHPEKLPIWEPSPSLPPHLVIEAHNTLSKLMRPTGWILRFPNRSCVHAFISHIEEADASKKRFGQMLHKAKMERGRKARLQAAKAKANASAETETEMKMEAGKRGDENMSESELELLRKNKETKMMPLMCAWKRVMAKPIYLHDKGTDGIKSDDTFPFDSLKYRIDNDTLRVENCPPESTADDIRYFFGARFELLDDRGKVHSEVNSQNSSSDDEPINSVEQVVAANSHEHKRGTDFVPSATNTFLVRFASPSEARTALREKQNLEFLGRNLVLAQYSRQIIKSD